MKEIPPVRHLHETFYIEWLHFLTSSAMASADRLDAGVSRHAQGGLIDEANDIFDPLQNIVQRAGALSRCYWPTGQKYRPRGKYLRGVFNVTDKSPLRSREVRNRLEHFDEKLDDFVKEQEKHHTGTFYPSYFGPPFLFDDLPTRHFFRAYDPGTCVFKMLGEHIEMRPLVAEIVRIHKLLTEFKEKGVRFPPNGNALLTEE